MDKNSELEKKLNQNNAGVIIRAMEDQHFFQELLRLTNDRRMLNIHHLRYRYYDRLSASVEQRTEDKLQILPDNSRLVIALTEIDEGLVSRYLSKSELSYGSFSRKWRLRNFRESNRYLMNWVADPAFLDIGPDTGFEYTRASSVEIRGFELNKLNDGCLIYPSLIEGIKRVHKMMNLEGYLLQDAEVKIVRNDSLLEADLKPYTYHVPDFEYRYVLYTKPDKVVKKY
jgi:hypothetical protein